MSNIKPLPFVEELDGISKKTLEIHHDKLYAGYVKKSDEISEKLGAIRKNGDFSTANQAYSELRGLKEGETFAVNGVYLHEFYFDVLGGNGEATGELVAAIEAEFGSTATFLAYFKANGMVARGWAVLGWDVKVGALRVYTGDAHNHGGVWGCIPIIVLDVYEHAYFADYGADRAAYIDAFFKNLNWEKATEIYLQVKDLKLV